MLAHLRLIIAAAALCLPAGAQAAATPEVANGLLGVLDTPSTQPPRTVPTPRGLQGMPPWKIACYDYPGYRVKQLSGNGEGENLVSTQVFAAGGHVPACGVQDDPGEKLVSKQWHYFMGAKGGFLTLVSPEGYQVLIYDAVTGKQLYTDATSYTEIHAFDVFGDTATITYRRHLEGGCSILTAGASCWLHFVKDAKLPAEFAPFDAATGACQTAYQQHHSDPQNKPEYYTTLTYLAKVKIDHGGHSTTLSRSNLECMVGD